MRKYHGTLCWKTARRVWIVVQGASLCATSRAVTVANFRADVPAASVIRVVYTSNNLLLTPRTRRIVNIIDVRTVEDGEREGNCIVLEAKGRATLRPRPWPL